MFPLSNYDPKIQPIDIWLLCVKNLTRVTKKSKKKNSVQNGKNKNMTTFQIVWSYPKKFLVVIRQKLRTANFFSDDHRNFENEDESWRFEVRNFCVLRENWSKVLTFNHSWVKNVDLNDMFQLCGMMFGYQALIS